MLTGCEPLFVHASQQSCYQALCIICCPPLGFKGNPGRQTCGDPPVKTHKPFVYKGL